MDRKIHAGAIPKRKLRGESKSGPLKLVNRPNPQFNAAMESGAPVCAPDKPCCNSFCGGHDSRHTRHYPRGALLSYRRNEPRHDGRILSRSDCGYGLAASLAVCLRLLCQIPEPDVPLLAAAVSPCRRRFLLALRHFGPGRPPVHPALCSFVGLLLVSDCSKAWAAPPCVSFFHSLHESSGCAFPDSRYDAGNTRAGHLPWGRPFLAEVPRYWSA